MTKFFHVHPAIPLSKEFTETIQLYKIRSLELLDNFNDLTKEMKGVGYVISKNHDGTISSSSMQEFNRHRLKGLFLDYRALSANDDDIYFYGVLKALGKYYKDERFKYFGLELKNQWKPDDLMKQWGGVDFEQVSKALFNCKYFHTAKDAQFNYQKLLGQYCDNTLNATLFLGIQHRLSPIRNLLWSFTDIESSGNPLRIPEDMDTGAPTLPT